MKINNCHSLRRFKRQVICDRITKTGGLPSKILIRIVFHVLLCFLKPVYSLQLLLPAIYIAAICGAAIFVAVGTILFTIGNFYMQQNEYQPNNRYIKR